MLKIFGILLLSSVPILYCIGKSRQLRSQIQNLEGLIFFVRECRQGIEYHQRTVGDLIENLPSTSYKILDSLIFQAKNNEPFAAWTAIPAQECPMAKTVMDDFFRVLGTSDLDSQIQICDITIHQLEHIHDQFAQETAVKSRLYRTIGMLAGAFIAILFI